MITVKRLTLEDAKVLLAAAEAKARELNVTETIGVCDDGGHPIALHRLLHRQPDRLGRATTLRRSGPSRPFKIRQPSRP